MTRSPVLADLDPAGDRFYTWGAESFWSVTTIIGGGVPKYLHNHYAKMAAELALEAITERGPHSRSSAIVRRLAKAGRAYVAERQAEGQLTSIKKAANLRDDEAALRWLKGAAERHRDAAAIRGSDVHDAAELLALEHAREASELILDGKRIRPWPAAIAGYQAGFEHFVADWRPIFLMTEATVFHRAQAYAGTLDAGMRLALGPHRELLDIAVDYKSGRQVWPDVGLQLAPYARGEFIGGADGVTEFPMPPLRLDIAGVLHILPKPTPTFPRGYRFRLVRIDEEIWRAFLFAREVYRFQKELAGTVFLQDPPPPFPWRIEEEPA